jgi:dUTP pyrophosphatase
MTAGAAGFDLCACLDAPAEIAPGERALVGTGIRLAIPEGWEGQVRPRSGLALAHGVTIANAPGTIDADYRGELRVILLNAGPGVFRVEDGDRIAQLVFARVEPIDLVELPPGAALPASSRGTDGFGSTGRR